MQQILDSLGEWQATLRPRATYPIQATMLKLVKHGFDSHKDSLGGEASIQCYLDIQAMLSKLNLPAATGLLQEVLERLAVWQKASKGEALSSILSNFLQHPQPTEDQVVAFLTTLHPCLETCEEIPLDCRDSFRKAADAMMDHVTPAMCNNPGLLSLYRNGSAVGQYSSWKKVIEDLANFIAMEQAWASLQASFSEEASAADKLSFKTKMLDGATRLLTSYQSINFTANSALPAGQDAKFQKFAEVSVAWAQGRPSTLRAGQAAAEIIAEKSDEALGALEQIARGCERGRTWFHGWNQGFQHADFVVVGRMCR